MITREPIPFVVFHINWRTSGYSERYFLPLLDWGTAAALAVELGRWRIAACATGSTIIWARLAFTDRPALSEPVRCIGLTSDRYRGPGRGVCEDPFMRLHYRYETADGCWNTRLFGAIPDRVVREFRTTMHVQPHGRGQALPDRDDPDSSWAEIFRGMCAFVRDNTVYCVPARGVDPPAHRYETWNESIYRKVANRKTGRDFLPVSWESARTRPAGVPGVDPPTDAAAAFTPCAAKVGVLRSCYSRPCQWYVNGPLGRIRYYFVPETNEILWRRTVFWPYQQYMQIVNTSGRGERTHAGYRWDRGNRNNELTGEHPHGTDQDFAGESPLPWTPPTPTPIDQLPLCDFPEWPPEIFGEDCGLLFGGGDELPAVAGGLLLGGGDTTPAASGGLLFGGGLVELATPGGLLFGGRGSREPGGLGLLFGGGDLAAAPSGGLLFGGGDLAAAPSGGLLFGGGDDPPPESGGLLIGGGGDPETGE